MSKEVRLMKKLFDLRQLRSVFLALLILAGSGVVAAPAFAQAPTHTVTAHLVSQAKAKKTSKKASKKSSKKTSKKATKKNSKKASKKVSKKSSKKASKKASKKSSKKAKK
jgi:flagellar biosynthesis component FlhA